MVWPAIEIPITEMLSIHLQLHDSKLMDSQIFEVFSIYCLTAERKHFPLGILKKKSL